MKRDAVAVALLVAVVAIAHGTVTSQWWLWDDPQLLYGAMRFGVLEHFLSPQAWQAQSTSSFVPMLQLATEIDLALFGAQPRGFYMHHLLVLAAGVIALYAYLRAFTPIHIAAMAAGAFALSQPAFTVATLLMDRHYAAGLLCAVVAMMLFRGNHPVAGALLYLIACLEKEVYVTLPLLVVAQALASRRGWRVAAGHGVLCGVAGSAYVVWRMVMLGSFGGYGGAEASLKNVVVEGWMVIAGARGVAALGALTFALGLAILAARRAPKPTILLSIAAAVAVLLPIGGLVSLDSRYFFVATATTVVLAAIAAKGRVESYLFAALCLAIAIGGTLHGLGLRRDLGSWQRDGLYLWNAASTANPLFTTANGWYIEGVQWLRRTVKGDEPPRVIASVPGLVITGHKPPPAMRAEYGVVRAMAAGDLPLSVELSLRDAVFSWSLGPAGEGDAFFFVTPNYELIWTRTARGWVRLPADVRVTTASMETNRRLRVMRRSGTRWTVSAELPMPGEGGTIRWQRGAAPASGAAPKSSDPSLAPTVTN